MRRVALLRQRVAAVAAANRHTVALVEGGHAFSWGSNLQGQLGYGTSDSASNAVPRIVEAMKARRPALPDPSSISWHKHQRGARYVSWLAPHLPRLRRGFPKLEDCCYLRRAMGLTSSLCLL